MYTSRNGILLNSPYEDWRFDESLDKIRKSITQNIICVPIKIGETCLGCMEIANKRDSEFKKCDYNLMIEVATELGIGFNAKINKPMLRDIIQGNEKITQIASNNLLNPLLKNILIILSDILKSEK